MQIVEPFTGLHWSPPYDNDGNYIEPQLSDFKYYSSIEHRWKSLGFDNIGIENMCLEAELIREYA